LFAKVAFGLAVVLATASAALAAAKANSTSLSQSVYTNVYNPSGADIGTDPDLNLRFELNPDWARGHD
jgi:hypothetical protein